MRPLRIIAALISVVSILLGSPNASAQEVSNLIDLGAVAPGLGINNNGEVVLQNYIYSNSMLTAFPSGFTGAAINASGEVAGTFGGGAAGIYSNGTATALPAPNPLGADLMGWAGNGINDSGDVVVVVYAYDTLPTPSSSLYYSHATSVYLPVFDCDGVIAQAINDSGVITGGAASTQQGCDWNNGLDAFLDDSATSKVTDLGPGFGYAINASGQVTGIHYTIIGGPSPSVTAAAFLYSNSKLSLLSDTNNCTGYGINAGGFVVGTCAGTAFFYNGSKVTIDLDTFILPSDPLRPYVSLRDARGINDNGLVIVNGIDSRDNMAHAYLMQMPQSSTLVGAAPPPAKSGGGVFDSLSLSFLIGMLALHRIRRKIRLHQ